MQKIYTGIGSRETPKPILELMQQIGWAMAMLGFQLRSGYARGADQAFEAGADKAKFEDPFGKRVRPDYKRIYLPWPSFNKAGVQAGHYVPPPSLELQAIAERHHPNWNACSSGARKMHIRNVCQILGMDMRHPSGAVICWTPGAQMVGGTAQALRIAETYNVPIFNLADDAQLNDVLQQIANQPA